MVLKRVDGQSQRNRGEPRASDREGQFQAAWSATIMLDSDTNRKQEVQDSVARLLRAPPCAARHKELGFGYPNCLRSQGDRSTVVVGNCTFCTDNGGRSPGQGKPLWTFVDPVSAPCAPNEGFLVEPPGTAPGSDPLITSAFMSIVPKRERPRYRRKRGRDQGGVSAALRRDPQQGHCRTQQGQSPEGM